MTFLVPLVVLIPLIGAALTLTMPRRPRVQQLITIASLFAIALVSAALVVAVDQQGMLYMQVGEWDWPFGITIGVDRLSAMLIGVSALVLLGVYLFATAQGLADGDEEAPVAIFSPTYLVLGAGVTNAFIAQDLFNLYVGFEILLVASYVLITLGGTSQRINAGTIYVVVSLLSSILFLAAIALIYGATGTVNMAQLSVRLADVPQGLQVTLNVLLLLAFGIKAAAFPLGFWLPDSYPTAPAPVTAVFAGLLTKVGVYAIIRTQTLLFVDSQLDTLLYVIAALTLVIGILGAVAQLDIKRMLSFVLISHIGYLIFGVAIASSAGYAATTFYIVHHIIVQTTLFITVGVIERMGGTSTISSLGGLMRIAPAVALMALIPLLNLGGIPPFSGFIGKVALFEAAAAEPSAANYWLIGVGAFVSLVTLYVLLRAWVNVFWKPRVEIIEGTNTVVTTLAHLQEAPEQPEVQDQRRVPKLMMATAWAMVGLTITITVVAGPFYDYATRAGEFLSQPHVLVEQVAGEVQDD